MKDYSPAGQIDRWAACSRSLFGFDLDEHTRAVHQGVDPGYRKV